MAVDAIARDHALNRVQTERVAAAAARVRECLPQFFGAGSEAELDLMDPNGKLLRVDRLVEHDDALWIVDFKWSVSPAERPAYEAQVRGYAEVLRAIRDDKPVRTALIDADGQLSEVSP